MSVVYDEKLLDKTGLAMVPSAYKGAADEGNTSGFLGKVYSVLPAQTIGGDIITNGTFDVDANWSKGTGWDITGGKAVCDGTQTANTTLVQQSTILGANLDIQSNKTYRITFDVTVDAGAITYIELSGNVRNDDITESQVGFTFDLKSGTSGNDRFTIAANQDFVGSVDNVKLQLISNGDFDFSRGSDATRVNSQGYIESVQVLSDELITNGGFDTTRVDVNVVNGDFEDVSETELITNGDFSNGLTNWTAQEGWYADNGVATFDYTTIITTSNRNMWQTPLFVGKVYKLTFDIVSYTSGFLRNVNSTVTDDTHFNSVGTFTQYFVAASPNMYLKCSTDAILSIDNVSVKEVGQNWDFSAYPTFYNIIEENNNKKLRIATSGSSYFYSLGSEIQSGKQYRLTFNISNYSGTGALKFEAAGVNSGFIFDSNGDKEFYFRATSNGNLLFRTGGTPFNGDLDNIVLEEIQGAESWNFNSIGWYIDNGTFNAKGGANYTATFPVTTVQDKPYRLTIGSIENISGGTGLYAVTLGSNQVIINNNSSSVDLIIKGSTTGSSTLGLSPGSSSFNLDNVSLKEVTDDTDIPRLDYSDGCPTLLLEPERINRITKSNEFSAWANTEGSTVALTTLTNSPENKQNAYLHTPDTSNTYHRINSNISGLIDAPSNFTYTISLFVKPNGYDYFNIRTYGSGGSNFSNASFNLADGTVDFLSPNFDSSSIEEYKNGWYRVTLTTSPTSLGTVYLRPQPNGETDDFISQYTGDGESGCFYYGFQLEQGSYPTSYIPTDNAIVTRRADICNNAGDSTIFNDSEGVLFIETLSLNNSNDSGVISIRGNQSPVNLVTLKLNYSSNTIQFFIYNNGNLNINRTINYDLSNPIKLAIKYSIEESSIWVNGEEEYGGLTGFTGFSANNLKDISFDTFSNELLEAKVRSVLYFDEALSNAELEYITSSDIDVVLQNNKLKATMLGDTYEDGHVEGRLNELF